MSDRGAGSHPGAGAHFAPSLRVEAYFGLLDDLRDMFGREIDLVMVGAVKNRYVAQHIQHTKHPLYAA